MLTYFEQIVFKVALFLGVVTTLFINSTATSQNKLPAKNNPPTEVQEVTKNILPSPKKEVTVSVPVTIKKEDAAPVKNTVEEKTKEEIPPPQLPTIPLKELNEQTRNTLVNILCVSRQAGPLEPSSASGVLIDKRGIILTNAHIAQYLLLQNLVDCVIREGNPAQPLYKANLLYISQNWVSEHAKDITSKDPAGTGENDFALIQIGDPVSTSIVKPAEFPFLPLNTDDRTIKTGDAIIVAGYPAEFLGGVSIQRDLFAASSAVNIGQLFAFQKNDVIDLFSVGSSIVAQKGSSGGPVVNTQGLLTGIVAVETAGVKTSDRDLRAISISHIDRAIKKETGLTLNQFISGDIERERTQFESKIAPRLRSLFEQALASSAS